MTVRKIEMFTVDCTRCGQNADEGTDYSCWPDESTANEMAREGADYREYNGGYYCPECVEYDEETDDWKVKMEAVDA